MPVYAALIVKCEDCSRFVITARTDLRDEHDESILFPDPRDSGWELVRMAHPPVPECRCPHHRLVNPEPLPAPRIVTMMRVPGGL